jgi:hypothetical protein
MSIADKLAEVRERIASAARRAGRQPGEIALMAVSKTHPVSAILEAMAAGQLLFGENRVQEFAGKVEEVRAGAPLLPSFGRSGFETKFHLIGHLQSNKAAKAAELFDAVDSVDSLRLAEKLNEAALQLNRQLDVLIEVNIGGEAAKSGLGPASDELQALLEAHLRLSALAIRGLMAVPPVTPEPEAARPYFRRLRELRDRLRARSGLELPELSMGMSHDFEVAIEEGSTCVRIGTAIFGERPHPVAEERPGR